MTFDEILDQAIELLQRRGRVSYRALKAQFHLDDELLETLKAELIEVHQQAQDMLDDVYRLVQDSATSEWMRWRYSLHLLASLGEFWLARGDSDKAQAFADQCLASAVQTNSRKYMIKSWRLKGEIAHARRQWEETKGWLQQALSLAQTVGNPTQLWKAYQAMGHLHRETHRPEMARHAYQAAREVIDHLKMNLQNPELQVNIERSALIQQVYDLSANLPPSS
jgi:tetratricopeptide (TPR) repeat protein